MLNKLSEKQGRVWLLTAMAVPLLQSVSGCSWVTVLAVGAVCFAICWGLDVLRTGEKIPGWMVWLQRIWLILLSVAVLDWISYCWPDTLFENISPLIVLIMAAWTVGKGERCAATASGILRFVLALLLGTVLLSNLKVIRPENLRPIWQMPNANLVTVMLVPAVVGTADGTGRGIKDKLYMLLFSTAAAIIISGVLSLPEVYNMDAPFYELSRNASFLDVAKRLESLSAAAMTVGYYVFLCLLLSQTQTVSGEEKKRESKIGNTVLIGIALIYLSRWRLDSRFLAIGSIIFWVLLPTIQTVKNDYKKCQKPIDK